MSMPVPIHLSTTQHPEPPAAVFPHYVPLSDAERAELKRIANRMPLLWLVGILILGLGGLYIWKEAFSPETMSGQGQFFEGLVILFMVSLAGFYLFLVLHSTQQYQKDLAKGIKQIGLVEVVSKTYCYSNQGGSSYWVYFKWIADPAGKQLFVNNRVMYRLLESGDKAYLEFFPNSKDILVVEKR